MTTSDRPSSRSLHLSKWHLSVLLNAVAPFIVYLVARPFVGSDLVALLLGVAIPVVVTLAEFVVRRRIDRIGLISIAAFAILIGLLALTGGNPLVLKLAEAIFTGPLGLAGFVSVLIGKPLIGLIKPLRRSMNTRQLGVMTSLISLTLVTHCLVVLAFALVLPTAQFLAIGRPAGVVVIAAGLLALRAYRIHLRKIGAVSRPTATR